MQGSPKLVSALVVVVALGGASTGCKKKPAPPTTITYQLHSKDLSLDGATATVGGKSGVFQKRTWSSYNDIVEASVTLPIATPSPLGTIGLELPTPCGTKKVALKFTPDAAAEERAKKYGSAVIVDVTPAETLPGSATIWVDADATEKLDVGTLEVRRGSTRIYDYECTSPVTIRAGSRDLGVIPTFHAGLKTHGVFVTTKSDACYSYEGVVYSTTPGGGSHRSVFRDKNVYPLTDEKVDYFLRSAPSSMSGGFNFVYELVNIPCSGGGGRR